jgi:hypothetical protein
MPLYSPIARETERLLGLLLAYDREELWLRARQLYQLSDQASQLWVDVIDADGIAVPDRFGRVRTHTLQIETARLQVVPGQLVRLRRDGEGVSVQVPPPANLRFLGDDQAEVQGHVGAR